MLGECQDPPIHRSMQIYILLDNLSLPVPELQTKGTLHLWSKHSPWI